MLKGVQIPAFDEEFDPNDLDRICETVCKGLSLKLPKWERFLTGSEIRKGRRYRGFQEHIWGFIMKGGNQRTTGRQSTKASVEPSEFDHEQGE